MKKGFTLIELVTAVSIFIIVVTISMGSILGIFDANRKSRSLKTVMTNLNLAIESMSKEMRYGKTYHCGTTGTLTDPENCPGGGSQMSFLSADGVQITYAFNSSAIEKQVGTSGFVPVTAPETIIDSLTFYTLGAGTDNLLQPKVLINVKGHAGGGRGRSDFILETMVSQRALDI